jgi:Transglycosylase SLT domain
MKRRRLPPRSLAFSAILIGLVLGPVPDLSAESHLVGTAVRVAREHPFRDMIALAAAGEGVDPALVEAVVAVESDFSPFAVSRKGAMGLMQLMPETARRYGVANAFDPRQNLIAGIRHLRDLLRLFGGDLPHALAAYNAGANAVLTYRGIPPYRETHEYVRMVLARYRPRRAPPSPSAALAGPAGSMTFVLEDADEERSGPEDLPSGRRLVRTSARHPVPSDVRAPIVQMREAPTVLVRSREYPAVRSRHFAPDRAD